MSKPTVTAASTSSRPTAAAIRAEAYRLLGVDPNTVLYSARFSDFFRRVPGGIPEALATLRMSDLPDARRFMRSYDDVTLSAAHRKVLPLEAFAVAAGVTADQMISTLTAAIRTQAVHFGSIKAAIEHSAIVAVSIAQAKLPEGIDDRTIQLKHLSFLPSPKGSQVNVNVAASATAQSAARAEPTVVVAPESTVRRLVDRFNTIRAGEIAAATQHALPAPSSDPDPLADLRDRSLDSAAPVLANVPSPSSQQDYLDDEEDV